MIKSLLLLVTLLYTTLSASDEFSPYITKIDTYAKGVAYVPDNGTIKVGSSGIIEHSFDASHSTIIATVVITDKIDGKLRLKILPFKNLEQQALPNYSITPKVGDKVILNYLYNRALPITPSKEIYTHVINKFSNIDWIHPDIFAAKLLKDYNPTPSVELFQKECRYEDYALIFLAVDGKGEFIDCNSMKSIKTVSLPVANDVKAPFYSRIIAIKGRLFGLFGGDGVKNYDNYYKKLFGIK